MLWSLICQCPSTCLSSCFCLSCLSCCRCCCCCCIAARQGLEGALPTSPHFLAALASLGLQGYEHHNLSFQQLISTTANQCQPRGAKRVGVQVPSLLQRSRKVPKWHPPLGLAGPFWPGLSDHNMVVPSQKHKAQLHTVGCPLCHTATPRALPPQTLMTPLTRMAWQPRCWTAGCRSQWRGACWRACLWSTFRSCCCR